MPLRFRSGLIALVLVLAGAGGGWAVPGADPAASVPPPVSATAALDYLRALSGTDGVQMAAGCCKHCSKGKACGDSCIARDRRCSKGAGCACD